MMFYEKIGLARIVFLRLTNRPAFYWRRGMILYLFERLLPKFFAGIKKQCKKLDYGYVESANGVKKNVHEKGQKFLNEKLPVRFLQKAGETNLFQIDFANIFKIFIFSEVIYPKYEFFELAIRYASEHPNEKHIFCAEVEYSDGYDAQLQKFGRVCDSRGFNKIMFVFSILLSPILLRWHRLAKGQNESIKYENNIICNSVKASAFNVFRELFGEYKNARYTVSRPYSLRFSQKELNDTGISYLGLSRSGYDFIKKYVLRYVYLCLDCSDELARYGSNMLRLFNDIVVGRAEAPHGKGNAFITYEHFYASRAIRNEFIRLEGSKSVFLPQTQYISPKYYFTEFGYNYDIVCSSGKHLEDSYVVNKGSAKNFLPTGGYAMHRGTIRSENYEARVAKLRAFKGTCAAVTILSCGLVDMSRNIERKLMLLANKLAHQPDVKVFVRLKSRRAMPYFDEFYTPLIGNEPSIMATSQEYELWDFLPVTDLFITDISGSGCDMAMRGGQVIYVDFLNAPDFFLFWEKISGVRVSEDQALTEAMTLIRDGVNGQARIRRRETMRQLKEYMAYSYSSFEDYKKNLTDGLGRLCPCFHKD